MLSKKSDDLLSPNNTDLHQYLENIVKLTLLNLVNELAMPRTFCRVWLTLGPLGLFIILSLHSPDLIFFPLLATEIPNLQLGYYVSHNIVLS